MPIIDRGPKFGGYYSVNPDNPKCLYGISWLHAWPCGSFVKDGITYGVTFFIFYKDEFPDCKGESGESFDMQTLHADATKDIPIFHELLNENFPADVIENLKKIPKGLTKLDISNGKSGEEIIDGRTAILVEEFLGFTLADLERDFPELIQPITTIDEDWIETTSPNIRRCSLEDN